MSSSPTVVVSVMTAVPEVMDSTTVLVSTGRVEVNIWVPE